MIWARVDLLRCILNVYARVVAFVVGLLLFTLLFRCVARYVFTPHVPLRLRWLHVARLPHHPFGHVVAVLLHLLTLRYCARVGYVDCPAHDFTVTRFVVYVALRFVVAHFTTQLITFTFYALICYTLRLIYVVYVTRCYLYVTRCYVLLLNFGYVILILLFTLRFVRARY